MFGSVRAMQSITRAQSIEIYLSFSNLSFDAVLLCGFSNALHGPWTSKHLCSG